MAVFRAWPEAWIFDRKNPDLVIELIYKDRPLSVQDAENIIGKNNKGVWFKNITQVIDLNQVPAFLKVQFPKPGCFCILDRVLESLREFVDFCYEKG